jgi:hypothetical protein
MPSYKIISVEKNEETRKLTQAHVKKIATKSCVAVNVAIMLGRKLFLFARFFKGEESIYYSIVLLCDRWSRFNNKSTNV